MCSDLVPMYAIFVWSEITVQKFSSAQQILLNLKLISVMVFHKYGSYFLRMQARG
jgi:hypothetical protein